MKYYRYMSIKEFQKLTSGMELIHSGRHDANTDSVGFCFIRGNASEAVSALAFLSGIVTTDVLVEFESETELVQGQGIYADPFGDYFDSVTVTEYCTEKYSLETMHPVQYAIVSDCANAVWYSVN